LPHVVQVPFVQSRPLLQVCAVPQQGWPLAPQPEHTPAVHTPADVPVLPPEPLLHVLFSPMHLPS
jgi:hypothetical protein